MTPDDTVSPDVDAALRRLLHQHDPAGPVMLADSFRLEGLILNRLAAERACIPQLTVVPDFFVIPSFLGGALSGSTTLAVVMVLGLMLGLSVASLAQPTTPTYTLAALMADPWEASAR